MMLLALIRHELAVALRDSAHLMTALGAIAVGLFCGYLTFVDQDTSDTEHPSSVLIVRADPTFSSWLVPEDNIDVSTAQGPAIRVDGRKIIVDTDQGLLSAAKTLQRVQDIADRQAEQQQLAAYQAHQIDVDQPEMTQIAHGPPAIASPWAPRLPATIAAWMFFAAWYAGVGCLAVEKEQKTAETIGMLPFARRTLITGKALVVWMIAIGNGLLLVGSLAGFALYKGQPMTLLHLTVLITSVLFFSLMMTAIGLVMGALADSMKSATMMANPVMLIVMGLLGLSLLPSLHSGALTGMVPMLNVAMFAREGLQGIAQPAYVAWALGNASVHCALLLTLATRLVRRPEGLIGGSLSMEARRAMGWYGMDVFIGATLTFAMFMFSQNATAVLGTLQTAALGQIVLALCGLLLMVYVGAPLRQTAQLRTPTARNLVLGLLAGCCMPLLGVSVGWLNALFLPANPALAEGMLHLFTDGSLPMTLLVAALFPGLFEEWLFRGAFLGMLTKSMPWASRLVVVAIIFSIFHFALDRLGYTFALGLVLGFMAWRTGSMWVGVVAHVTNNAIIIIMLHQFAFEDYPLNKVPWWGLALGSIATLVLTALMRPPQPQTACATDDVAGPQTYSADAQ